MKIYRSLFINGVVCDVVLASDAEEIEMKEIVKYAVVTPKGDCVAIFDGEDEVRASGYYLDTVTIVKLTGQMPEPPKKPRLMAPALLSDIGHVEMSCYLYASEQEARDTLGDSFISWPAIPNKDGMYEVLSENIP